MSIKEYKRPGTCEIHTEIELVYRGDDTLDTWYECPECRVIENNSFFDFIEESASKVGLWPTWKGGDGLGVGCPCCKGNSYVTPEFAAIVTEFLSGIEQSPFLPARKIKRNEKGQGILK